MGYFPWLVSCRLIRLNPGVRWGRDKNVLCSDWEGEYVHGQSWTVIVGHQVKLFAQVKDLPRSHFREIYGQCRKFASVISFSITSWFQFLLYYIFIGCLQRYFQNLVEHLQGSFFCENNSFKLLTIFEKRLRRRCSTRLKIGVWLRV